VLYKEFLEQSAYRIGLNYPRIKTCIDLLSDTELWQRPNASSNSIGNLVLHLCGNMTQYIISALGKNEDKRDRDSEFSAKEGYSAGELLEKMKEVNDSCVEIINGLNEEQLLTNYEVQGYTMSGIAIIIHVTEHYSYHTGQIVFLTKSLKDTDTGFYKGKNLNIKNK
jgi:uncharacterized damage-inducible protein DinB